MTTTKAVPITVTPDAAGRIQELGRQREFEQMVEHIRQTVPDLQRLEVQLDNDRSDPTVEPVVVLWAWRPDTCAVDRTIQEEWFRWSLRTFPVTVRWQLTLMLSYQASNGR